MRWLLTLLVLCTAAGVWGWQALGLGVDLGSQPAARDPSSVGQATTAGLLATSFDGRPRPAGEPTAPSRLTGASAAEDLLLLRQRMDRPALRALADRLATRVSREPDDAEALFVLCEASRLLGRVDDADLHSIRAVERFPHIARAHLERARALGEHMKRVGALGALRFLGDFKVALGKALELDPHDVEARCDRIGFLSFAPGLLGGDADLALEMARELAAVDVMRGVVMEVVVLAADGEPERAVERAELALRELGPGLDAADEDLRQLHLVLASALTEVEEYDRAAEHYERAAAGPDDTVRFQALYMHAKQRLENDEQHAEALADMELFIAGEPYGEFMPFLGAGWWRKGQALEGLGRFTEALAAYDRALDLDPESEKAIDSRDELLDRMD